MGHLRLSTLLFTEQTARTAVFPGITNSAAWIPPLVHAPNDATQIVSNGPPSLYHRNPLKKKSSFRRDPELSNEIIAGTDVNLFKFGLYSSE